MTQVYPFAAVVGQDAVKKVLIWNMVNPLIGGVLISGEKGTAKSTLVRGISHIAPDIRLVELPLNVTEDRLCGNINFEHAVKYGEKRFEAGILHHAHGNILYVDEVNLLSDHIVKTLLESASSGMNIFEREGISHKHASRFILVGSMNPEEGGLRPQFLDRFGLYVEVSGEKDTRIRAEIIRRRVEYEKDPAAFCAKWREESEQLRCDIRRAKAAINRVEVTANAMQLAAAIAREGNCAGHRAELVIVETAKAIAAMDSRIALNISDIKEAAQYALPHRTREKQEQPPYPQPEQEEQDQTQAENPGQDQEQDQDMEQSQSPDQQRDPADSGEEQKERQNQTDNDPPSKGQEDSPSSDEQSQDDQETDEEQEGAEGQAETLDLPGESFIVSRWLSDAGSNTIRKGSGKRSLVKTSSQQGRYVRYRYPGKDGMDDLAFDATLRAAAPYQVFREKNGRAVAVEKSDIRVKIREKRTGNTIVFVVDASGSMGANKRMAAVKGAILSLLNDAYQKRDKVGMIAFKNHSAELLLGITRSVELAEKKLAALPTGGRTPLAAGLNLAYEIVKAATIKDKDTLPVIVLVSDGRATYSESGLDAFEEALAAAQRIGAEKIKAVVIDTDQSFIKLNLTERIAKSMNADSFIIEDLRAQNLVAAVSLSI
ncbi:VWA domain-containing protein [Dehalobacter sp. DCM]|uniref:VWA domain-containing protein n=1 Tax=Dehalobacter sp. DCM TaxID=2907827 RepID=UPI00308207C2|nr:VWA domain-containing protein [Dehalobacter sp. DCM]